MAEPDTLPPDPFAPEKPLHRRMSHRGASKLDTVTVLLALGVIFASAGVAFLFSAAAALVVLGGLLIAAAVAAYRTLEDE